MTDERRDEAKKETGICPNCGKERNAGHQEATARQGVCPKCGAPRGEGGARRCSCSTTGGG